ncbi:MAG TPA: CRISPR-associated endonuclease Cas3'', partial [Tahibacter sp.]|nr:CRISPR-associated endonuclease Cas3'' [Tahibacter sp.]
MKFYAHSGRRADYADWQPLSEHSHAVGERAATNAAAFGGQALARPAGILHDLGKYTEPFQGRLRGEVPRMDHASWGAFVAQSRYKGLGTLMAYAIAGHHAGLANGATGEQRGSLRDRLSDGYRRDKLPPLLPHWEQELTLPATTSLPVDFIVRRERGLFQLAFLTRMIFSCL